MYWNWHWFPEFPCNLFAIQHTCSSSAMSMSNPTAVLILAFSAAWQSFFKDYIVCLLSCFDNIMNVTMSLSVSLSVSLCVSVCVCVSLSFPFFAIGKMEQSPQKSSHFVYYWLIFSWRCFAVHTSCLLFSFLSFCQLLRKFAACLFASMFVFQYTVTY